MKEIKYLDIYKKEYEAFWALFKLSIEDLKKVAYVAGLDLTHVDKEASKKRGIEKKKCYVKPLLVSISQGHGIPTNFQDW